MIAVSGREWFHFTGWGIGNRERIRLRIIQTPSGTIKCLRYSPDGRRLWVLSNETEQRWGHFHWARSIDIPSGSITADVSLDPTGHCPSNAAIFSPDTRSVYRDCGGDYYTDIRRVDLATGRERILLQADFMFVRNLTITPNEHILALGGIETGEDRGYGIRRVDVIHGTVLDLIRDVALGIAYSPDGRLLAVGGQLREDLRDDGPLTGIRIWDGKRLVQEFPEPAAFLTWSPEGRLAWGMNDGLALARPGTAEPTRTWRSTAGELAALSFSRDSQRLVTGTVQGLCSFHDIATGRETATFNWGIGPIHSVAFSPDGLTCAAGGEEGQIVVWDVDF